HAQQQGLVEDAARWAFVAAKTVNLFPIDRLASPQMERLLVSLIPDKSLSRRPRDSAARAKRWLHVMSAAHGVGGHTALVQRWVRMDQSGDEHNLALTFQKACSVESLTASIVATGGHVTAFGDIGALSERARALRALSDNSADAVV